MSYRFADSLRAGSGQNWFHPDHARKLFYFKNKFGNIVHLVGFIIRKISRMLGTLVEVVKTYKEPTCKAVLCM